MSLNSLWARDGQNRDVYCIWGLKEKRAPASQTGPEWCRYFFWHLVVEKGVEWKIPMGRSEKSLICTISFSICGSLCGEKTKGKGKGEGGGKGKKKRQEACMSECMQRKCYWCLGQLRKHEYAWTDCSRQAKVASQVKDHKGMVAEPAVTGWMRAVSTGIQLAQAWESPGAALSGCLLSLRKGWRFALRITNCLQCYCKSDSGL